MTTVAPSPAAPPTQAVAPDLSIVIVSWNTRQLLDDCLRSVYESFPDDWAGGRFTVWVVDNDSADGSADLVRDSYPQAKLIANTENYGFAVANNQALKQASGRYLLLLNSDTVVPPGALNRLVEAMDRHPEAAVCSPLLRNPDGSPQICWARFPDLASELSGTLDRSDSPYPLADFADESKRAGMEPFPTDWVGGACFLTRASSVAEVGLLDEDYFMYSEETDWCRRFRRAGGIVLLVPSVTVTHLGGQSSRAVPVATRRRIWRSSLRFYRKAYGPLGSLPASLVATARYLLFPLRHRWKMRAFSGGAGVRRMADSRLRVALDARPLSHPQAGGFRAYVRSLTRGLRERAEAGIHDVDLIYYLDRPLSPAVEASLPPGATVRILDTRRIPTDLLFFPRAVRRDAPDLVHGTMNYLPPLPSRRITVTIHDAMGIMSHSWERNVKWPLRDRLVNRYWYVLTLLSLRHARRIVTVSQGSAAEIGAATGQAAERFRVVYNGIDLPPPAPNIARFSKTVLMFHSPDSRKNAECIYRAFAENPRLMPSVLRIVCSSEKTAARAQEAVAQYRIEKHQLLCGLSDQALSDAYAAEGVFVWPSRLEGFGLPPLEAMRNGCPVVSSSAPVMPEILGDAPLYFDPDRPDELADRLLTLLNDPVEAARRSEAGRQIAAQFTCRRMADETVAVWKEAASG